MLLFLARLPPSDTPSFQCQSTPAEPAWFSDYLNILRLFFSKTFGRYLSNTHRRNEGGYRRMKTQIISATKLKTSKLFDSASY